MMKASNSTTDRLIIPFHPRPSAAAKSDFTTRSGIEALFKTMTPATASTHVAQLLRTLCDPSIGEVEKSAILEQARSFYRNTRAADKPRLPIEILYLAANAIGIDDAERDDIGRAIIASVDPSGLIDLQSTNAATVAGYGRELDSWEMAAFAMDMNRTAPPPAFVEEAVPVGEHGNLFLARADELLARGQPRVAISLSLGRHWLAAIVSNMGGARECHILDTLPPVDLPQMADAERDRKNLLLTRMALGQSGDLTESEFEEYVSLTGKADDVQPRQQRIDALQDFIGRGLAISKENIHYHSDALQDHAPNSCGVLALNLFQYAWENSSIGILELMTSFCDKWRSAFEVGKGGEFHVMALRAEALARLRMIELAHRPDQSTAVGPIWDNANDKCRRISERTYRSDAERNIALTIQAKYLQIASKKTKKTLEEMITDGIVWYRRSHAGASEAASSVSSSSWKMSKHAARLSASTNSEPSSSSSGARQERMPQSTDKPMNSEAERKFQQKDWKKWSAMPPPKVVFPEFHQSQNTARQKLKDREFAEWEELPSPKVSFDDFQLSRAKASAAEAKAKAGAKAKAPGQQGSDSPVVTSAVVKTVTAGTPMPAAATDAPAESKPRSRLPMHSATAPEMEVRQVSIKKQLERKPNFAKGELTSLPQTDVASSSDQKDNRDQASALGTTSTVDQLPLAPAFRGEPKDSGVFDTSELPAILHRGSAVADFAGSGMTFDPPDEVAAGANTPKDGRIRQRLSTVLPSIFRGRHTTTPGKT